MDGEDNDLDGETDGRDSDCPTDEAELFSNCRDERDDDRDGLTDLDDPGCWSLRTDPCGGVAGSRWGSTELLEPTDWVGRVSASAGPSGQPALQALSPGVAEFSRVTTGRFIGSTFRWSTRLGVAGTSSIELSHEAVRGGISPRISLQLGPNGRVELASRTLVDRVADEVTLPELESWISVELTMTATAVVAVVAAGAYEVGLAVELQPPVRAPAYRIRWASSWVPEEEPPRLASFSVEREDNPNLCGVEQPIPDVPLGEVPWSGTALWSPFDVRPASQKYCIVAADIDGRSASSVSIDRGVGAVRRRALPNWVREPSVTWSSRLGELVLAARSSLDGSVVLLRSADCESWSSPIRAFSQSQEPTNLRLFAITESGARLRLWLVAPAGVLNEAREVLTWAEGTAEQESFVVDGPARVFSLTEPVRRPWVSLAPLRDQPVLAIVEPEIGQLILSVPAGLGDVTGRSVLSYFASAQPGTFDEHSLGPGILLHTGRIDVARRLSAVLVYSARPCETCALGMGMTLLDTN